MEIREARDFTKLSLEKFIGSWMTNEITIEKQQQEDKPKKNLAFKIINQIKDDDDDNNYDDIEEDITLITK